MSNYFEKNCERYIKECEDNGVTFQKNIKNSLIQGAKAQDSFFDPNYYRMVRLRMLSMLLKEAKDRGWFDEWMDEYNKTKLD